MQTLHLGIPAHVDAGKTAPTERLLRAAVDDGKIRNDSLALEQKRIITRKPALVSFAVDGVADNPLATPGHPGSVAGAEWVVCVLGSDAERYQPIVWPPARPRTQHSLPCAARRSLTTGGAHAVW
jgi:hypothetical protein